MGQDIQAGQLVYVNETADNPQNFCHLLLKVLKIKNLGSKYPIMTLEILNDNHLYTKGKVIQLLSHKITPIEKENNSQSVFLLKKEGELL